jgi:lysophospholipase L1-like esterase
MIFDVAARVILMPVLIGQALVTRARAEMLPEPDGTRSGVVGNGPPLRLLVIGDSSAAGVGTTSQSDALIGQITQRLSQDYTVSFDLVAETGARTAEVLTWLPTLPSDNYDVVITALGVNDVTKGTSLRTFLAGQQQLIEHLINKSKARLVIVSGLPPIAEFPLLPHPLKWALGRQGVRFDGALRKLVGNYAAARPLAFDMTLEPSVMSTDGFHPGPTVYARWAELAAQVIMQEHALLDAAERAP